MGAIGKEAKAQRPRHHTHQHDVLIPKRFKKNGIVRMKPTSASVKLTVKWTDISPRSYQQTQITGEIMQERVAKNVGNLQHPPSIMAKRKKIAMRGFLNSTRHPDPACWQAM